MDGSAGHRRRRKPKRGKPMSYSVTQFAAALAVTRQTVYKYLSLGNPDDAVISPADWYKLPGGAIRIKARALAKIMDE